MAADSEPDTRQRPVTEPLDGQAAVSDSVLSVRNLRTEFATQGATVAAVRDVSLELGRGQRIAIVGESGSGKSALALSVLGLIEPPGRVIGGEVILNGRDIARLREREMDAIRGKEISVVFQDPMTALDPVKTIGSQVIEAIRKHQTGLRKRAARRLAAELLRDVEVPSPERRLDQYPHEYSGGMRQRVMIAIALANQPDVLIADEPTTALDVTTQAQVMDLLSRAAAERGAAVILITHNLGVVAGFCDLVLVMYAGRLVERAPTDVLFAHPTHPYTEALLRCVPRPDRLERGPLVAIPGLPPNLADLPPGCSFAARCPVGSDKDICHTTTPVTVQTAVGDREVSAECHFAQARSAQHASALPINSQ